jgi:hypothetical protein
VLAVKNQLVLVFIAFQPIFFWATPCHANRKIKTAQPKTARTLRILLFTYEGLKNVVLPESLQLPKVFVEMRRQGPFLTGSSCLVCVAAVLAAATLPTPLVPGYSVRS